MSFRSYADDTISSITRENQEKIIPELKFSAFPNQKDLYYEFADYKSL